MVLSACAILNPLSALSDQDKAGVLVSVMAANNETGVIQPLEDIGIYVAA